MNNQLQVIISEQNIEKTDAQKLVEAFGGPFEEAGEVLLSYKEIVVQDEDDIDTMRQARENRLVLKKARTTVENKRKELKADIVKQGRAIDSVAKYVKEQIEPAEEYLELQEKFAEIKEKERRAQVKAERIEKLSKYIEDVTIFDIDNMSDEQFDQALSTVKAQRETELEAERKAEAERLAREKAEREEQERIRKENEKLRAEAEAREKAEAVERQKREAEEAKRLEAERKERERIQAEADAKLAKERAEREKLEAEKRAREEAERLERERIEKEERDAKKASDSVKLKRFSEAIEVIRREKLPVVSDTNRQLINQIDKKLAEIQEMINDSTN